MSGKTVKIESKSSARPYAGNSARAFEPVTDQPERKDWLASSR